MLLPLLRAVIATNHCEGLSQLHHRGRVLDLPSSYRVRSMCLLLLLLAVLTLELLLMMRIGSSPVVSAVARILRLRDRCQLDVLDGEAAQVRLAVLALQACALLLEASAAVAP
jgi:hypothetical protein